MLGTMRFNSRLNALNAVVTTLAAALAAPWTARRTVADAARAARPTAVAPSPATP